MRSDPTLTIESSPAPADRQIVGKGIDEYNRQYAGDANHQELAVFVRDAGGRVIGGLLGDTYYGWLAINLLWIDAAWRGRGYGRALLHAAEAEAVRRGCHHAHLDTLSFQALDFYLKEGYTIFGQLDDLPPGHTRYFLQKNLETQSVERRT
ncbi:MAG: GNAT family N-acetyltransferase [Chloroflexi bacterium]|nr:MAG: GNAT family N-acetyltransferase [Chloroflexota bacterium]